MKSLIIYYSRTGNTANVAKALEAVLDADMCEIRCDKYSGGGLRYLMAGYHSVLGRLPDIVVPDYPATDYDLVLIGTPVWTSHPSLPVRAFLSEKPRLPDRIGLFMTCGGHSAVQKAVDELSDLIAAPVEASLAFQADRIGSAGFTGEVERFADTLKKAVGRKINAGR